MTTPRETEIAEQHARRGGARARRPSRLFSALSAFAATRSSAPTRVGSSALSAGFEKAATADCATAAT